MLSAAEIVKGARLRAGLTQAELARRAGTTQSAIARIESGRVDTRLGTLAGLVEAAGQRLVATSARAGGIDETALVRNLQMTPEERLRAVEEMAAAAGPLIGAAAR